VLLRGAIDAITTGGRVRGWVSTPADPTRRITVALARGASDVVGLGFADQYRDDLAEAGIGLGWCAFDVRTELSPAELRKTELALIEVEQRAVVCVASDVEIIPDPTPTIRDLSEISACDPNYFTDLNRLRACDGLMRRFLMARGIEAFLSAAYIYVLGRAADRSGLETYGRLLRGGRLTPIEALFLLSDSDEFRGRVRTFVSPKSPSFPFRLA